MLKWPFFVLPLMLAFGFQAFCKPEKTANDAILAKIDKRLADLPEEILEPLPEDLLAAATGEILQIPIEHLIRGRARISVGSIRRDLEEMESEGEVRIRGRFKKIKLKDDESFDPQKEILGVKTTAGFIVVGGLEEVYLEVLLDKKAVTVRVSEDFTRTNPRFRRDVPMIEVWHHLKALDLVRLAESAEHLALHPPSLRGVDKRTKIPPSHEILATIEAHLREVDLSTKPLMALPRSARRLGVGGRLYLPLSYLIRGQDFISAENIVRKAEIAFDSGGYQVDEETKQVESLAYDRGRSSMDLRVDQLKTQVAKTPAGFIIIDGHHEAYSAILVGSKTVPVEIVADYTEPRGQWTMESIWADLQQKGMTLMSKDPAELARERPNLQGISDMPNRYLARLIAMKVLTETTGNETRIVEFESRGVKSPVWIKVDKGIPFVEFYLAEIFTAAGLEYSPKWGESDVPDEVVEKCREVLLETQKKLANRPIDRLSARDRAIFSLPVIGSKAEADAMVKTETHVFEKIQPFLVAPCGLLLM